MANTAVCRTVIRRFESDPRLSNMEGRSPEFLSKKPEITEKGFSEKRAARIIEGKQQDNSQVKKRKPIIVKQKTTRILSRLRLVPKNKSVKRAARVSLSLKDKILAAYEKNSEEIQRLMRSFSILLHSQFPASEQLMAQMRARQHLQEELLNALALEGRGELTEETLSKELVDLIK